MKRLNIVFWIIIFISVATVFGWHFVGRSSTHIDQKIELANDLKKHVYKLSHEIGDRSVFKYENLNQAFDYIVQTFKSFGYEVALQSFQYSGRNVYNIVATKLGSKKPLEQIIVGAHYDTCYNVGADDNASGVSGLLELSRLFSDKSIDRTMKFIAFVNEEPPFFKTENMGSRIYAKMAKAREDDIKAIIIFEMIGFYSDKIFSQKYPPFFGAFYPNKANFTGVVGNFNSGHLVKRVTKSFKRNSTFPIESIITFPFVLGVDFSDHWSFWKEGYKAIMITDTAFYRNHNYHRNSDTYDTLNYNKMSEIVFGFEKVLEELANL